ncbi:glycosyltransferase involved in cell wall biosynthesis [Edaphobacter modestus]|uniref:Glycosyltransferase involved in cell wall biosynthesis n=2 Tax=Edaphobacter modestus TaxID=388466 RepID=A0A4Q7YYT3_9BACT|nr:glycosyltransferase involved in cell wall biosynthesis [Edaphobacter modestus]
MRIAQIAPLFESVPPTLYGGSERVVSWLTEELVRMGHDVTLFASGDSRTSATLVPGCPKALWRDLSCRETLPHHVALVEEVFRRASEFDVLHFHCDYVHFPLVRRYRTPTLTTMHGLLHPPDLQHFLKTYSDIPLVSISHNQRVPIPDAMWAGTVYHGLPEGLHTFCSQPEEYLAFLGRISPDKGIERAIEIAKQAGMKLKIAAKIYEEDRAYFERQIEPILANNRFIEFVGEVGGRQKDEFLGKAKALLFPVEWAEPFGLVMIEALACGTPVIGWQRGAVPEVIEDGVNGYTVKDISQAVERLSHIASIDRSTCRNSYERRFRVDQMASSYVTLYEEQITRNARR